MIGGEDVGGNMCQPMGKQMSHMHVGCTVWGTMWQLETTVEIES